MMSETTEDLRAIDEVPRSAVAGLAAPHGMGLRAVATLQLDSGICLACVQYHGTKIFCIGVKLHLDRFLLARLNRLTGPVSLSGCSCFIPVPIIAE